MVRLYVYMLELLRTSPGSTIILKRNEGDFEAMYVCLAPLRVGCRHLISLDGCYLEGLYEGQLLSTVGIDANDCVYLLHGLW